jgi:hypothetical protein
MKEIILIALAQSIFLLMEKTGVFYGHVKVFAKWMKFLVPIPDMSS